MTITNRPKWSLGRGNAVVPSRWQATVPGVPRARRLGKKVAAVRVLLTLSGPPDLVANRGARSDESPRSGELRPRELVSSALWWAGSRCDDGVRRAGFPRLGDRMVRIAGANRLVPPLRAPLSVCAPYRCASLG
jgi:hypothetical protein